MEVRSAAVDDDDGGSNDRYGDHDYRRYCAELRFAGRCFGLFRSPMVTAAVSALGLVSPMVHIPAAGSLLRRIGRMQSGQPAMWMSMRSMRIHVWCYVFVQHDYHRDDGW